MYAQDRRLQGIPGAAVCRSLGGCRGIERDRGFGLIAGAGQGCRIGNVLLTPTGRTAGNAAARCGIEFREAPSHRRSVRFGAAQRDARDERSSPPSDTFVGTRSGADLTVQAALGLAV